MCEQPPTFYDRTADMKAHTCALLLAVALALLPGLDAEVYVLDLPLLHGALHGAAWAILAVHAVSRVERFVSAIK